MCCTVLDEDVRYKATFDGDNDGLITKAFAPPVKEEATKAVKHTETIESFIVFRWK
jgi:hypothetical protein